MNLYLTGFMGAGKTTVGRRLARRLGWRFLDLDDEIARRSGRPVTEIFLRGEESFRRLESRALRRIARGGRRVVALGAGALLRTANQRLAARTGEAVWLTASEAELWRRLRGSAGGRPLLAHARGRSGRLRRLMRRRRAGYAAAALRASTTRRSPEQAAAAIVRWLRSRHLP